MFKLVLLPLLAILVLTLTAPIDGSGDTLMLLPDVVAASDN